MLPNEYRDKVKEAALALKPRSVYRWLTTEGYFPEPHVLPPCFSVEDAPVAPKRNYMYTKRKWREAPPECVPPTLYCQKSEYSDRPFRVIDPRINNDLAIDISGNWKVLVERMIPSDSCVTSYSFPVPIDLERNRQERQGRAGRVIYGFVSMAERDLIALSGSYAVLLRADIRRFYPSIYTHSIAWAIESKKKARAQRRNLNLVGNRIDRLLQCAGDGKTNGIPVGPAVSDVAAEIVAAAVDIHLTKLLREREVRCEVARFKDDYWFLLERPGDEKVCLQSLQSALAEFDLELADDKVEVRKLPEGLFRPWRKSYSELGVGQNAEIGWKRFVQLSLAVLEIDSQFRNTGVIDRFLADLFTKGGVCRVRCSKRYSSQFVGWLLTLARRRPRAWPGVLGVLEHLLDSRPGQFDPVSVCRQLEDCLPRAGEEQLRDDLQVAWIAYFARSNGLRKHFKYWPKGRGDLSRSVTAGRSQWVHGADEFTLWRPCRVARKAGTILDHIHPFTPAP